MIVLTPANLDQLRTANGGFTKGTIEALGMEWPLKSGWLERLVGQQISQALYDAAKRARGHKTFCSNNDLYMRVLELEKFIEDNELELPPWKK